MRTVRACLAAILVLAVAGNAWAAACPPRVVTRLGRAAPIDRDQIYQYWKQVAADSKVEEGLVVAFDLVEDLGSAQVANILRTFPEAGPHFERIAKLREAKGLKKEIADLGSGNPTQFQGAAAELRYASEVLDPTEIDQFQFVIPGAVPDVLDKAGNLHEVKFRSWTDQTPDFLIVNDLDDILRQADIEQRYAAAQGKSFTLAFEVPVPPRHQVRFEAIFGEFLTRPNVSLRNGF